MARSALHDHVKIFLYLGAQDTKNQNTQHKTPNNYLHRNMEF